MSNQYQTQGYTVNDAGRRLIVDPITRIEGHMRCEVNIDEQNVITNAVSCGTMFRGLEIILQGRDPRDAWRLLNVFVVYVPGYMLWHRCTLSKMRLVSRCRITPILYVTSCWLRCGVTIIWSIFIS